MPANPALTKILLLPSPATASGAPAVRRYRLARVRTDDRVPGDRFAHLKRSHD
jgi:hypothetical protein